jgi:hypothetical protein
MEQINAEDKKHTKDEDCPSLLFGHTCANGIHLPESQHHLYVRNTIAAE